MTETEVRPTYDELLLDAKHKIDQAEEPLPPLTLGYADGGIMQCDQCKGFCRRHYSYGSSCFIGECCIHKLRLDGISRERIRLLNEAIDCLREAIERV